MSSNDRDDIRSSSDAGSIHTLYDDTCHIPPGSTDRSSDSGSLNSVGEKYEFCPIGNSYTFTTYHYDSEVDTSDSDNDDDARGTNDSEDDDQPSPPNNGSNNNDGTNTEDSRSPNPGTPDGSDTTEPSNCTCIPRCNRDDDNTDSDNVGVEELISIAAIAGINNDDIQLEHAENRCTPLYNISGISRLAQRRAMESQTSMFLLSNLPPLLRRLNHWNGNVDASDCSITEHQTLAKHYNHTTRPLTEDELLEEENNYYPLIYPFPLSPNDSRECYRSDWSDPDHEANQQVGYIAPPPSPQHQQNSERSDRDITKSSLMINTPYHLGTIMNGTWIDSVEIHTLPQPPSPSLFSDCDINNVRHELTVSSSPTDDERPEVTEAELAEAREIVAEYYDDQNKKMYAGETRDRNENEQRQLSVACGISGERISRQTSSTANSVLYDPLLSTGPTVITKTNAEHTDFCQEDKTDCDWLLCSLAVEHAHHNAAKTKENYLQTTRNEPIAGTSHCKRSRSPVNSHLATISKLPRFDHDDPRNEILQELARASALAEYSMHQVRNRRMPGFERPTTLSPDSVQKQMTVATTAALKQLENSLGIKQSNAPTPLLSTTAPTDIEAVYIPTSDDDLDETSARDDDGRFDNWTADEFTSNNENWQY